MTIKKGAWSENNQGQRSQYQASLNEALVVSCASMNVDPSPNLTLTLNGRPWEETSATAQIQDASPNNGYSSSSEYINNHFSIALFITLFFGTL